MSGTSESVKSRLREEARVLGLLFLYLAVLFGTFTTYKRLLLAEYGISYLHYGCSLIEAFILAKAIMVGRMVRLGDRFRNHPLVVPTLYKTFCFGLLVMALTVAEHAVTGWWHGDGLKEVVAGFYGTAMWEGLSRALILVAGFVPLFAALEAGRYLDLEWLARLFFSRPGVGSVSVPPAMHERPRGEVRVVAPGERHGA